MAIHFFEEDISFKPIHPRETGQWIKDVIKGEKHKLEEINYIFCSDTYLLEINQQYLNHDTYTDIITFDNSDEPQTINGDIFISIPRVEENANKFDVQFEDELHRVLIHGVLHLLGYKDKTPSEKTLMREKENTYLNLWRINKH